MDWKAIANILLVLDFLQEETAYIEWYTNMKWDVIKKFKEKKTAAQKFLQNLFNPERYLIESTKHISFVLFLLNYYSIASD